MEATAMATTAHSEERRRGGRACQRWGGRQTSLMSQDKRRGIQSKAHSCPNQQRV